MSFARSGNRGRSEKRRVVNKVADRTRVSKGGRGAHNGSGSRQDGRTKARRSSELEDIQNDDERHDVEEDIVDSTPGTEDNLKAPTKSFSALLQSFHQEADSHEQQRKRRKLQHESDALVPLDQPEDSQDPTNDVFEDNDEDSRSDDEVEAGSVASSDADGTGDSVPSDPYEVHFSARTGSDISEAVKQARSGQWRMREDQDEGGLLIRQALLQADTGHTHRRTVKRIADMDLKRRLKEPAQKHLATLGVVQRCVAAPMFNYQDVMFGARTPVNALSLRRLASLHALNHIMKGRDKILKNNERLARAGDGEAVEYRDQGFTRPKVLILLETRQSCHKYVEELLKLAEPEQRENMKRFEDAFEGPKDKYNEDMPEDFRELFEGNDDNEFRVGVKFTRKTVKLYSQFYASDIIMASPLGLRRIIENEDSKKSDSDFLSSIEVAIVDQTDAMLMQNWEHVDFVLAHLNQQPKEAHGCDFSRVRNWYLDQQARSFRQTVIFSAFITPELNRVFNSTLANISGKVKITPSYAGAILDIGFSIKQTFSRFDSPSPNRDPDARFTYFTTAIIPAIVKAASTHGTDNPAGILVFAPSYLEFVRLRNYFAASTATENLSFGAVSEYTPNTDTRRARSHFMSGRNSVLLYSGRAHHFHRYRIKGVKKVIFYALPDNPRFYTEAVGGFIGQTITEGKVEASDASARALFSKWDGLRLERVVGSDRVKGMLREQSGDTFDFV